MGKHTQLGRVWETGKFQNSSDCCKPIFSIPFSCHFSSLIFAVPRQCPVLKRPFHLMQNHPKTPQEAPEELSVSEASAVLTFRHRVEIAKKKNGLASRVCSGVSKLYDESLQNCHTDIFWVCFVALLCYYTPQTFQKATAAACTAYCDITSQLVRSLPRFLSCSLHRLLLHYHWTQLQSSCTATHCKHFLWVLQSWNNLQSKKTTSHSVWNPTPWEGQAHSFYFTSKILLF